ncbi:hypothetical protein V5T82_05695 [Magnetovibrio sp. PR-2]|uniref:hypothetical protein n=1 Tax=Magnetovibrio sp. PR-2 TaxID=3120356 RepID=UPI002FCDFA47
MALMIALPAQAGEMVQNITAKALKSHLKAKGYEVFLHEDEYDHPQLLVTPPGVDEDDPSKRFAMRLMNCVEGEENFLIRACAGYEYWSYQRPGFPIKQKTFDDWNLKVGHARGFRDDEFTYLSWYVHVGGGFSWDNIDAQLELWQNQQELYKDHLDESVMD